MSINQYYSSDLSQTQWWPHPKHLGGDANNEVDDDVAARGGEIGCAAAERLFEKPLTPSDVGKLNRLVIPKQHAEKHFPLGGGHGGGETVEKGLLLGFEDEAGKSWRFRYSYWNSSQSYVLTKGWSRYVKEKRLDAGDVVVFARHRVDAGRLFIGWRRRCSADVGASEPSAAAGNAGGGWNPPVFYPGQYAYPGQHMQAALGYQPDSICSGAIGQQQSQTISKGNSKRLRLFGVNMECYQQADESDPLGSPQGPAHHSPYHNPPPQYYYPNHMDISFSEAGVYRQG